MTVDDDRLLHLLGEALRGEDRQPPPERVAALRARALEARPAGGGAPSATTGRPRWPLAAAAAVLLVAVLGVASVLALRQPDVPREPVALSGLPAGVEADAELVAHTWGTELILVVSGLADGESYTVRFSTDDGQQVSAGTFLGVGDAPLVCSLNAAVLRPDATSFEVVDEGGAVVMRSDI